MWKRPNIKGIETRLYIDSVMDDNGKMYIFGGTFNNTLFFNDMAVLDTVELSWSISIPANSPNSRVGYTATLLSNGIIVYIGGWEFVKGVGRQDVNIKRISLYDTKSLTWSMKVCINAIYNLLIIPFLNKSNLKFFFK